VTRISLSQRRSYTGVGSQRYLFHRSIEKFSSQYRRGGSLVGSTPSNSDYIRAVRQAFVDAGYDPLTAGYLTEQARLQLSEAGLAGSADVPRIPGRLNQARTGP